MGTINCVSSGLTQRHTLDVYLLSDQLCRLLYRGRLLLPKAAHREEQCQNANRLLHFSMLLRVSGGWPSQANSNRNPSRGCHTHVLYVTDRPPKDTLGCAA